MTHFDDLVEFPLRPFQIILLGMTHVDTSSHVEHVVTFSVMNLIVQDITHAHITRNMDIAGSDQNISIVRKENLLCKQIQMDSLLKLEEHALVIIQAK